MRNLPAHIQRLPKPVAENWEWRLKGDCNGHDTLFFSPHDERGPAKAQREAKAKAICAGCPILKKCREHALEVQEPFGVWGGLTEAERDQILKPGKKRKRTR